MAHARSTDRLPPFPHPYREVSRLDSATVEDIQRFLERDEPVAMPNAIARTAFLDQLLSSADDQATLATLTNTFGDREIAAAWMPASGRQPGSAKRREKMPFRAFAQLLADQLERQDTPERVYMQNHPIGRFPEIGWKAPALARSDWELSHSGLWIGPGGHTVTFHYDNSYNFICMLAGQKRVALLPFEVLPDVYPVFDAATNVTWSSVRLLHPDLARYPNFGRALENLRVVTLDPGDILFVPPHWWHHVESFGLNVMISNWGSPFPLKVWRAIGRVRVEAMMLFNELTLPERERYAAMWDRRVFRNPGQSDSSAVDLGAEPAGHQRLERNLAEAADLFERVPEIWRRRGQLAFHYFVFQTDSSPIRHEPGAFESLIGELKGKLARGEVSPLG